MNDARLLLAHLSWHPAKRRKLLERHGSASALLRAIRSGRVELSPGDEAIVATPLDTHRERLERHGARAVPVEHLPELLRSIPDAPDVLFVRGILPEASGVAVVGSRKATGYGLGLARAFGARLADAGVIVVSGLARGIDAAAHRGALGRDGTCVAVLGNGIDRWYPAAHRGLGEGLLAGGGAVVSEYAPGTPPAPWRFPARNRIISGLVEAVVVVEAAEKGGALITARTAADQGRTVMAVPGDVDRPTAVGANRLIRDGALPVLDAEDLVAVVATATSVPVKTTPEDPLIRLIGIGRRPEWLAAETGLSAVDLFVQLGRLESEGRIEWRDGLVVAV